MNEVVKAQEILAKYGVAADVWSATSYNELYRDAHRTERWNLWHPTEPAKRSWVAQCLADTPGVVVAASDYLKSQPDMISRWIGRPVVTLGTDGFGRSEDRVALRDFFEVDAKYIAAATLSAIHRANGIDAKTIGQAFKELGINPGQARSRDLLARRARGRTWDTGHVRSMTEIKLPELGENVEKGDVIRVLVNVGDVIKADQPVVELETDKATIEVPSSAGGKVTEIGSSPATR